MQTDPRDTDTATRPGETAGENGELSAGGTPVAGERVPAPGPEPVERETRASAPIGGDEGTLTAAVPAADPGALPADAPETAADARAQAGLAGARTARVGLQSIPLSPAQLAWRKLRKNRMAVVGGIILIVLYSLALFAPFLAPYGYASQDPSASFRPPMRVHWTPAPLVYATTSRFNQFREKIYVEDRSRPILLKLFAQGEPYHLLWVIPTKVHLFGTEGEQRVYLLGTDQFGRDNLSRLLYAAQISLSVGLIGIAISFTLGLFVGGLSGFYGGRIDDVIMRICEVFMSVPSFYLLLALAAALPPDLHPAVAYVMIIAILSFVGWAAMARVIRGMVLSAREREYVEAARALGVSDFKIITRHILPSTFTYAIISATLSIPGYILGEAGLSFLSLGIRDPMPSWGNMLTDARNLSTLEARPWMLFPGALIFVTTLAFNFLGDGLRDALDPKSK